MSVSNGRASVRRMMVCSVITMLLMSNGAWAQASDAPELGLPEAERLALSAQPLITGLDAQARAARESAVAASQLPDPQLKIGLSDLPINTDEAYSLTRDSDTSFVAGISQEFPRAEKRRLRGELLDREATRIGIEREQTQRSIRRDAALAWLEVWRYQQALTLTQSSLHEADVQMQLTEISLRTGSATQAEYLAARQEVNRLSDAVSAAEQSVAHARNMLSRWIGDAAWRPITSAGLSYPELPPLDAVLARLRSHPSLAVWTAQAATARTGIELAQASYAPDWRVELGYANRPAYSDMVSLQVGIDLPFFTANRQDRGLAAALAQKDVAESRMEDERRQLTAEVRLNHHDFNRLQQRLKDYDDTLLPQSAARIEAAMISWRSARGQLRDVIDARRAALEVQMARLDLQNDLSSHFVQLTYLGAYDSVATTVENQHE